MGKPICIFIMGRPGAGKDTQSEILTKKFNLVRLITSNLIQKKFRDFPNDPYIQAEKKRFDSGLWNTPSWVLGLVQEEIQRLVGNNFDSKSGIVFSGSPRTMHEAEEELPLLEKLIGLERVLAINLEVSTEEGLNRILQRAGRELDRNTSVIMKRMEEHDERTKPVLDYFDKNSILVTVDGRPSIEEIAKNIDKIVNEKFNFQTE